MKDDAVLNEITLGTKDPTVICGVCQKKYHRYVCPKCNLAYCTLSCYKSEKHSKCSEEFYERLFCEELKTMKINSREERKKVEEMINRVYEDDENDSECSIDTEKEDELLKALEDLKEHGEADELLRIMSKRERDEFSDIISGKKDSSSLVETSRPWWIDSSINYKVEEGIKIPKEGTLTVRDCSFIEDNMNTKLKDVTTYIRKKIDLLNNSENVSLSIGSWKDSEILLNNIAEIVPTYVYSHLYVMNDLIDGLNEATKVAQELSLVLRPRSRVKYETPLIAWTSFCENLKNFEGRFSPSENLCAILANTISILSDRHKVLRVLRDTYGLFIGASKFRASVKKPFSQYKEVALKIRFYFGLYRDCKDSNKWTHKVVDVLMVKKKEYACLPTP